MSVIVVFAISRFVTALGLMMLFGSSVLLASMPTSSMTCAIAARSLRGARGLSLLALVGVLLWLPLEAADIGDGWTSARDGAMMMQIVMLTGMGKVWCFRVAATLLTVITTFASAVMPPQRSIVPIALASGLALATSALSGHAAANDGMLGALHQSVDAVHVLAAGAWFGSLFPFFALLRAARHAEFRAHATKALLLFSNLGHATVAITLLSGVANTWLILRTWPFDWHVPYQVLLCVKMTLALVMTCVAIWNRYVWVPRLKTDSQTAMAAIYQRTVLGVALGVTVIGLVAFFGMLSPQ